MTGSLLGSLGAGEGGVLGAGEVVGEGVSAGGDDVGDVEADVVAAGARDVATATAGFATLVLTYPTGRPRWVTVSQSESGSLPATSKRRPARRWPTVGAFVAGPACNFAPDGATQTGSTLTRLSGGGVMSGGDVSARVS